MNTEKQEILLIPESKLDRINSGFPCELCGTIFTVKKTCTNILEIYIYKWKVSNTIPEPFTDEATIQQG